MKLLPILGTVVLLGMSSTPAFAVFCSTYGPDATFDFDDDDSGSQLQPDNDRAQKELDLQRLRSAGVDANSVERWNGCLRAFVANPGGGESMEFYDPSTLRRLQ